jgi:hypothetical protein
MYFVFLYVLVMCNAAGYYLHFAEFHIYFASICRIALYFVGTTLRVLSKLYDSQETSPFLEEMRRELAQLATGVYLTKSVLRFCEVPQYRCSVILSKGTTVHTQTISHSQSQTTLTFRQFIREGGTSCYQSLFWIVGFHVRIYSSVIVRMSVCGPALWTCAEWNKLDRRNDSENWKSILKSIPNHSEPSWESNLVSSTRQAMYTQTHIKWSLVFF